MRSIDPKTELDETIELNKILTQGREATRVEGGTEGSRRSPPAVPRTRRSVDVRVVGAGGAREKKRGGRPFIFGDGVVIGGYPERY